jgi:hypothetical protein
LLYRCPSESRRLSRSKPTLTTLQNTIYNKLTSTTNVGYTVEMPRSALKTDEHLHTPATNTSYQVKSPTMELNMAMVEEKKYKKSEEPDEIDESLTDRTIQNEKEEPKKKLVITRRQVCELDNVRNTAKRPAFNTNENPHTLTTSPPEEPLQLLPILHSPDKSNPANLKLSSIQDQ